MTEENNVTEVISVKFKGRGKAYYFDANGISARPGDDVIVETSKGLEYATCAAGNHFVSNEKVVPPIRPVVRLASENDRRIQEINHRRENEAMGICREKIAQHGLDMKLVDVEISFEGNKITFYFTSDGRVDFRELVKDLAGVFRSRIELRQIGVRDEAKILGGLGMCGRPFCCSSFLGDFQPVSTKMAKTQSLSLNPTKISGVCGRLMCCLRYEEEAYESLVKASPKNGAYVETPAGFGTVTQLNLLRGTVKVKLDGEGDDAIKAYSVGEIAAVPGGRPKNGEQPQRTLKARPVPAESAARSEPEDYFAPLEPEPREEPQAEQPQHRENARRKSAYRKGAKPAEQRRAPEKADRREGEKPRRQNQKPRQAQEGAKDAQGQPRRAYRRRPRGGRPPKQPPQQ